MKPASIRKFDWLYLGSIVIPIVGVVAGWEDMAATLGAEAAATGQAVEDVEAFSSGLALIFSVLVFAISFGLWFLVSVLRIEFTKWVLALIAILGFLSYFVDDGAAPMQPLLLALGVVSTLMLAVAVYFLFQPDAKSWFAEGRHKK